MAHRKKLMETVWFPVLLTLVIGVGLSTLAWASARNDWLLALAASVGALGGLVHEIAQSRGKIMLFERHADGIYLGSVAGMVLGAVAGLLVIRGLLTSSVTGSVTSSVTDAAKVQLTYEIFLAGLAVKGVAEAAGGNVVPEENEPSG